MSLVRGEFDRTRSLTASSRTFDTFAKLKRACLRPRVSPLVTLEEGEGEVEVEGRRGQAGSSSGTSSILGWVARESSRREERLEAEDVALEERPRPFGGCEEPGRGVSDR